MFATPSPVSSHHPSNAAPASTLVAVELTSLLSADGALAPVCSPDGEGGEVCALPSVPLAVLETSPLEARRRLSDEEPDEDEDDEEDDWDDEDDDEEGDDDWDDEDEEDDDWEEDDEDEEDEDDDWDDEEEDDEDDDWEDEDDEDEEEL